MVLIARVYRLHHNTSGDYFENLLLKFSAHNTQQAIDLQQITSLVLLSRLQQSISSTMSTVATAAVVEEVNVSNTYWNSFLICTIACVVLQLISRSASAPSSSNNNKDTKQQKSGKFLAFQMNYLLIFLLAMFSDWLQGPYVYELYVSYGFDQQQIAELFVGGFASSMIVGTFVGSLADKCGRKTVCIL